MESNIHNPWKGLDSYNSSDASFFYGRKEDTEALTNAIVNNRITVLYGPSGVGKSSILNAGVTPYFSQNNYLIVNINTRELDLRSDISISSQIIAAVETEAKKQEVDIANLIDDAVTCNTSDSLWFYFHSREFWSQKNELLVPLIIIDQFEEVFKESISEQKTSAFFNKLDELPNSVPPLSIRESIDEIETLNSFSQSASFHFVFSLREDYLPRLDDYVYSLDIQELKKSRFSISPFEIKQAKEVILKPFEGLVSEEVANKIVGILSSNNMAKHSSQRIEPFLLSLFMYRVCEQMIKRNESTISEKLINEVGQDVVNDYYLESMGKVSVKAMKYLEAELLTQKGHRDSISLDRLMSSGKVNDKELETLLLARILKKNTINNVDRIEFTHDILSKYAQQNKDSRMQENKSAMISGILGVFISIVLAIVVGWIMNAKLTYISIPILISVFVFSATNIVKTNKSSNLKWYYLLILAFVLVGVLIDLTQVIPGIGYYTLGVSAILSLFLIHQLRTNYLSSPSSTKTIVTSIIIWLVSITIIPILCYGYNPAKGLNLARNQAFSGKEFYIINNDGKYGIRNRKKILLEPLFDTVLIPVNNGFIAKQNNKYGLINSPYDKNLAFEYDEFKIENDTPYFYKNGKEITKNGLGITWNNKVKDDQKRIIRKIIQNMVLVKGGTFTMGTNLKHVRKVFHNYTPQNGEEILHQVCLTDFYINKYEVTLEDWKTIMEYDARLIGIKNKADTIKNLDLPVYKVTHSQCEAFADKISSLTGLSFSLPTEAQWEYAATGGEQHSSSLYSGSSILSNVGVYWKNSEGFPHPIGWKDANNLELYDMTGNMAEYCKDCLSPNFYRISDKMTNPCCEDGLKQKDEKKNENNVYVIRGGSFLTYFEYECVVTRRNKAIEECCYEAVGFRLALNPE